MEFRVLKNDIPKTLDRLRESTKQRLLIALLQAAEILADETRLLAPVDTGLLKSSISISVINGNRLNVAIRVTALNSTGRPYDLFQEYGWTTVNGRRVEGRFYLHGAMANKYDEMRAIMERAIDDVLREFQ